MRKWLQGTVRSAPGSSKVLQGYENGYRSRQRQRLTRGVAGAGDRETQAQIPGGRKLALGGRCSWLKDGKKFWGRGIRFGGVSSLPGSSSSASRRGDPHRRRQRVTSLRRTPPKIQKASWRRVSRGSRGAPLLATARRLLQRGGCCCRCRRCCRCCYPLAPWLGSGVSGRSGISRAGSGGGGNLSRR